MSIEAMKQAQAAIKSALDFYAAMFGVPVDSMLVTHHSEAKALFEKCMAAMESLGTAIEQPAQQEPLEYWNAVEGWVKIDEVREHFDSVGCGTIYKTPGDGRVPLTTAQRTWVGLTHEEHMEIMTGTMTTSSRMAAVEAKLREKNA